MDYHLRNLSITLRICALRAKTACFLSLLLLAATPAAQSANINYGNADDIAGGGSVYYTGIKESSGTDPVPLYDTPEVTVNDLDFDPTSFAATSSGGVDVTDGLLSFGMRAAAGKTLESIDFVESGRYTLQGSGNASAFYGIGYTLTILAVDGVNIAPVSILGGASGSASLPGDLGFLSPWNLSHSLDLDAALTSKGISYTGGVTKAEIAVDDQLLASSDPGNFSFIDKKDFRITVSTDPLVPEPTTLALAGMGMIGILLRRKVA